MTIYNRSGLDVQSQPGGLFHTQNVADTPGNVFWVDSTNAAGGTATGFGLSPDTPFTTVAAAMTAATANQGDTIYVLPGHTETIGNATLTWSKSGTNIVGIGIGARRPIFNFGHANSNINITGSNMLIKNLKFLPTITGVVSGVKLASGAVDNTIEDCWWAAASTNTPDFIISLELVDQNHGTTINNCLLQSHLTAAHYVHGIKLTAGSTDVSILNTRIDGQYATACIGDAAACTDILVDNCVIKGVNNAPACVHDGNTTGVYRNTYIESLTYSSADALITGAKINRVNCRGVVVEGSVAEDIGTATETSQPVGSFGVVTHTLTDSEIVAAGHVVATATGTVEIVSIVMEKNGTAWDSAGHGATVNLLTNNVSGSLAFATYAQAKGAANTVLSLPGGSAFATSFLGMPTLETTKTLKFAATGEDVTDAGTTRVTIVYRRLSAGATLA